ncbi:hypothetical protein CGLO_07501 [Colletotrichum gloeosporioides Cg-14]|uniref:Uncharacterized protein n=1 Tax=Colletotrichum gloeosporioides (strain Cg-14) TaxID=1237896 RepID=T0KBS9_COLGC|nr:hypothetical protein CGLO_07501 [Colletotrichum gloeosporioides Cg-14]
MAVRKLPASQLWDILFSRQTKTQGLAACPNTSQNEGHRGFKVQGPPSITWISDSWATVRLA